MANEISSPHATALAVPAAAAKIVDLIFDRAKRDHKGAYWPLAPLYQTTEPERLENSLGFGSAGILLTLLEFYRRTADRDVAELIQQGLTRLRARIRDLPFTHGFYAGTPGLWYVCRQLEIEWANCSGDILAKGREQVSTPANQFGASIGYGIAGTIIGVTAGLNLRPGEHRDIFVLLRDQLVAETGLAPTGVFWDYHSTSLRPPLGFITGNAGVEYCLSWLEGALGESCAPLLAGSLSRARSLFDSRTQSWPDFDFIPAIKLGSPLELGQKLENGELPLKPEDSLGWGTGVTGILLGRFAVARSHRDDPVGVEAAADCAIALARISRTTDDEIAALDPSLAHGLSGIALAMRAITRRDIDGVLKIPAELPDRFERALLERQLTGNSDDLSLATGAAGIAYATLRAAYGDSVLDLLPPTERQSSPPSTKAYLTPLIKRRLPACACLPGLEDSLRHSVVGLAAVREAVRPATDSQSQTVLARSIEYELQLHATIAETDFRARYFAELLAKRRYMQRYAEGMTETLLFEHFTLDRSTTLLDLDYDPFERSTLPEGQRLLVVRQITSKGVIDAKATPLQFALLDAFRTPRLALDAIDSVIDRIDAPNVTPRQLAAFSLKIVRNAVAGGYLTPVPSGTFKAWHARHKLKQKRKHLFPPDSI